MSRLIDLTGRVFGRLTVLYRIPPPLPTQKQTFWLCRCSCKKFHRATMQHLLKGEVTSCGCFRDEYAGQQSLTHGRSKTKGGKNPEYHTWCGIKERTMNPRNPAFMHYGGRGICMCQGWQDSFENFLSDLGARPSPKYSIERKNNDGHYSCGQCSECQRKKWPANCCWATKVTQSNNTRRNHFQTYQGKRQTIREWAREKGINYGTLVSRLLRSHMTIEQALTQPLKSMGKQMKEGEPVVPLWKLAQEYGIPHRTLRARIHSYHWSLERALSEPVRHISPTKPNSSHT